MATAVKGWRAEVLLAQLDAARAWRERRNSGAGWPAVLRVIVPGLRGEWLLGISATDRRAPAARYRQSPATAPPHIPGMPLWELKKRKKFEPTSTALPAAS